MTEISARWWIALGPHISEKLRTPEFQLSFKKTAEANGIKYLLKESVLLSS